MVGGATILFCGGLYFAGVKATMALAIPAVLALAFLAVIVGFVLVVDLTLDL